MPLKSQYPDRTGFHFDLPPMNCGDPMQEREEFYGAKYVSTSLSPGAKPWLNWPDKFEPDPRYLAISDKNAFLQQFPEVDSPWKFTEYVYEGTAEGSVGIIEPPLYYPLTLTSANGVGNVDSTEEGMFSRKTAVKKGSFDIIYYNYMGASGKEYTQESLEAGIDGHSPWFDPDAPAGKGRNFTRTGEYKRVTKSFSDHRSGIRMYKKYVPVECVKTGAHGNIPRHVVNMFSPKEYFEPDEMYTTKVVPKFKATVGNALVAAEDGIVDYKSGGERVGIRKVLITPVASWTAQGEEGTVPRIYKPTLKSYSIEQPRLQVFNGGPGTADMMLKTKLVATAYQDYDFVHRGCAFFKGDKDGCSCTIQADTLKSGSGYSVGKHKLSSGDALVKVVSVDSEGAIMGAYVDSGDGGTKYSVGQEFWILDGNKGALRVTETDSGTGAIKTISLVDVRNYANRQSVPDPSKCVLYDTTGGSPKENYVKAGGKCPYYQHNGPREIALYETEADNNKSIVQLLAQASTGIAADYSQGGTESFDTYNQCIADSAFCGGFSMMGAGIAGLAMAALLKTVNRYGGDIAATRTMSDQEPRWTVEYEYVKILKSSRQTYKTKWQSKPDFETVVRGTGRMAFDKKQYSYGGIDQNFFGDINLLSSWRFNRSVLPCYNPMTCNSRAGLLMQQGYAFGIFAGTRGMRHCRYYGEQKCPHGGVSRRAYEFDMQYSEIVRSVLKPFRKFGIWHFEGIREYKFSGKELVRTEPGENGNGPYVAVGNPGCFAFHGIDDAVSGGWTAYFYYTKSVFSADPETHRKSDLYAHIRQYDHGGNEVFTVLDDNSRPSTYPSNMPWLVKIEDDYVSPQEDMTFVTNERAFFGGRHPEYKDFTKMGDEVMCMMGGGGNIYGVEGGGASNLGGDPKHAATQDKGYYMGYRIDKTGEYIVDGRSIGTLKENGTWEQVSNEERVKAPPGVSAGATPIKGAIGNTVISAEFTSKARAANVWIYSSDYRTTIDNMPVLYDDEGKRVTMNKPAPGILPTERKIYRCPKCNYDYVDWGKGSGSKPEKPKYPSENWVVTDLEYDGKLTQGPVGQTAEQSLEGKCPVCGEPLREQGFWTSFPEVKAKGHVAVWGLPGQEIRYDGIFWKNPTLINRSMIAYILGKLGPLKTDASGEPWGYSLMPGQSADAASESAVNAYLESRPAWNVSGTMMVDPSGVPDALASQGASGYSNAKIPSGTYADNTISPFDNSVAGIDFISSETMKTIRNSLSPLMGYEIGSSMGVDHFIRQQAGHRDRYGHEKDRKPYIQMGRLKPEVIAATETGKDQYSQFWDGTLYPAVLINHYWPTGPTWWRLHQYIGGISRRGGNNSTHLDASGSTSNSPRNWYTGDRIESRAFFFLHGWLPLDKEVYKAVAIFTPVDEPDAPPIGTVWSGVVHHEHYHAYQVGDEAGAHSGNDYENQNELQGETSASMSDSCTSYMWHMSDCFNGTGDEFHNHFDRSFGMNAPSAGWGGYIGWSGMGTDIVQKVTDAALWKNLTYDEFSAMIERQRCHCRMSCDDPENRGAADDFYIFSKAQIDNDFNSQVQSIPQYMDTSGMNTSLGYPSSGPVFEPKRSNSDWATGDQVIVQQEGFTPYDAQDRNWARTGQGRRNAGWIPRQLDITDIIRDKYNARLSRAYRLAGGLSFGQLNQHNYSMRNWTGMNDVLKKINYQYFDSSYGYWLNEPWLYPSTDSDLQRSEVVDGDECKMVYVQDPAPLEDSGKTVQILSITGWNTDVNTKLYFKHSVGALYSIYLTEKDRTDGTNSVGYVPASIGQHEITSSNNSGWSGKIEVKIVLSEDSMFTVEYLKSSQTNGRIIQASEWYADPGVASFSDNYYRYHPRNLTLYNNKEITAGSVPATDKYWYSMTNVGSSASFVTDLLQAPVLKEYRDFRYESGYWDISNAYCVNSSCLIGGKNRGGGHMTMAQYAETVKSSSSLRSSFIPAMHVGCYDSSGRAIPPKCPSCGADLRKTGALLMAGDGITTCTYDPTPDNDVFITAVKVKPYTTVAGQKKNKCSFRIETRGDRESTWSTMLEVDYDESNDKWTYWEYQSVNEPARILKVETELPDVFKGIWINADNLENVTSEEVLGKHFSIPRARFIRYTSTSELRDVYSPDSIGGNFSDITVTDNKIKIANTFFSEDEWAGGHIEMNYGAFSGEPDIRFNIVSNSMDSLSLEGEPEIPEGITKWRLHHNKYISACSQFEVYGYVTRPGDIVITGEPESYLMPLFTDRDNPSGITQFELPNVPTKIISVKGCSSANASIQMSEYTGLRSDADFAWGLVKRTSKVTGQSYYKVMSGKFQFDPETKTVYIPGRCKCFVDGYTGSMWNLNSGLLFDTVREGEAPESIEVKYISGNGCSVIMDAVAIGTGPSYQVEKNSVCNIAGNEPLTSTDTADALKTPADIAEQLEEIDPGWSKRKLPSIGLSAYVVKDRNGNASRQRMFWQVYNNEPMRGEFEMGFIRGDEMKAGGWMTSHIASLFGGDTQERAGLKNCQPSKIGGTVSGKVELWGAPKSIISGNVYVYAKDVQRRVHIGADGSQSVTYERTGGLKYTGFSLGAGVLPEDASAFRKGKCFGIPKVIVYLRERNSTEPV